VFVRRVPDDHEHRHAAEVEPCRPPRCTHPPSLATPPDRKEPPDRKNR
jgi:hypothetical protein